MGDTCIQNRECQENRVKRSILNVSRYKRSSYTGSRQMSSAALHQQNRCVIDTHVSPTTPNRGDLTRARVPSQTPRIRPDSTRRPTTLSTFLTPLTLDLTSRFTSNTQCTKMHNAHPRPPHRPRPRHVRTSKFRIFSADSHTRQSRAFMIRFVKLLDSWRCTFPSCLCS